jgi:predicted O-methyltransferase YrrM
MIEKLSNIIKTFIFLLKIRTSFSFLYIYIFFKIKNIIYKNIFYSRINLKFLLIKKFYSDSRFAHGNFFLNNAKSIYPVLKKLNIAVGENYLEIGSFEGSSLVFFSNFLNKSNFTCVDIWEGTEELKDINFKLVKNNFDYNSSHINPKNINVFTGTSRSFFLHNKNLFSIIYVDGNHFFDEVQNDLKESWSILRKGGILIMDDYIWDWYKNPKENPGYAINLFLKNNYKNLKILHMAEIVIIQKIDE